MMISLLTMFMMMFTLNSFSGVFLYLNMFIFFLLGFNLIGMDLLKGDLSGVLGLDYISFYMVLLLIWLGSLIMILFYSYFLCMIMLFLLVSMLVMFVSLDLLYLFLFFEFSMLPMFLIIMFFGSSKERYVAGLYMFVYTMFSSLPMLIVLMFIGIWSGSFSIDYMLYIDFDLEFWIKILILFMFLVKVPMFMVHIWLPKAHVEAPVFGSMILASVMLKMGGYGVIRCMDFMLMNISMIDFFFCFCLCGGMLISFICLYQIDLKVLVAYSSIVHMGMMLMGFFSMSDLGYIGGLLMMLSHGVCSSGMFYLVNEIYKISGSRLLVFNKGSMSVMPILIWFWFLMLVNNLGVPPCFGILGELMLFSGCLMYSSFIFFFFIIIIFFISCFVINMFIMLINGLIMFRFFNVNLFTYFGGVMHLLPLNFFIFFMLNCF